MTNRSGLFPPAPADG